MTWLRRHVFTTDHRALGILYLWLALGAVCTGTFLSLLMRWYRVFPNHGIPGFPPMKPEAYLALVTMHGTIMVFFVLLVAPLAGFANLVLPAQIGARRMAFPRVNAAGFWLTLAGLLVLLSGAHVHNGSTLGGWSMDAPLSALANSGPGQGLGVDLWIGSISLFCVAAWLNAVNVLTTIVGERCPGMGWSRLPLTVWAWFLSSILSLIIFVVLLAACVLLFSDRHFGSSFFIPVNDMINGQLVGRGGGSPVTWLHLFWFFGDPGSFITILPGMGLAASIFANFSRRRVLGYRIVVWMMIAIGVLGVTGWGHHMVVTGLSPFAATGFAIGTMATSVPITVILVLWLASLWSGGLRLTTPMLFMLGFLSFFITGGLSGPLLAEPPLNAYLHNTFFVLAHLHLVMGMAGVFSVFAGVYYWFPLMTGRKMNETLGRIHFWISLVAAYGTFFPMYLTGLAGEPRHYDRLAGPVASFTSIVPIARGITYAALLLAAAQLVFLWNLVHSARHGRPAGENPWQASTLEWASEDQPARIDRGPYEYELPPGGDGFHPQWESVKVQE